MNWYKIHKYFELKQARWESQSDIWTEWPSWLLKNCCACIRPQYPPLLYYKKNWFPVTGGKIKSDRQTGGVQTYSPPSGTLQD